MSAATLRSIAAAKRCGEVAGKMMKLENAYAEAYEAERKESGAMKVRRKYR